jgi:hypothetical protein
MEACLLKVKTKIEAKPLHLLKVDTLNVRTCSAYQPKVPMPSTSHGPKSRKFLFFLVPTNLIVETMSGRATLISENDYCCSSCPETIPSNLIVVPF